MPEGRKGVTSVPKQGKPAPLTSKNKVQNVGGKAEISPKPVKK